MKRIPDRSILPTGPPRRGRHEALQKRNTIKNKEKKHRL